MPALVSILIPCHNAARWLAEALDSAFAQTWPHREVILVDDGSVDGSLRIAQRYEASGLIVITQAQSGASAARNAALAASHGDYIQYLDADDLLAPDKLAHQVIQAIELDDDFALCGTWSRFHRSIADADFAAQPLSADLSAVDWLVLKLEQNRMMHPAAWLVPRSVAEQAGPWNQSLSLDDDGEYFTRVVLASKGVRHCPEAVSYYRSRLASSLSQSRSEAAWISAWHAKNLATQHLLAVDNSPRVRHACATALQRYIYEAYPRARECRRQAAERVSELGGSDLTPEGGPAFQFMRSLVGWRIAARMQSLRRP